MQPERGDLTKDGLVCPSWCQELLAPFGTNPFGENIFRVIWSPRKLQLFGGYWHNNGLFEYRRVQKYPTKMVWSLERWLPCKHYGSPETWVTDTCNSEGYLSLGPYPRFGVYETSYMFATPEYEYIPLLPDLVLLTVQAIWCGRIRTISDIRDTIRDTEIHKELVKDYEFEREWDLKHGVRRGISFSADGCIQNTNAEIEAKKQLMIASGVKIHTDEFQAGFRQA